MDRMPTSLGGVSFVRFVRQLTAGLALICSILTSAYAQEATGTVSGTVSDAAGGSFLEGAEVSVVGTELKTSTGRDGSYTLRGVPAGSQQILVNYPGLDVKTIPVLVEAGGTVTLPVVRLDSGVVNLSEFRVRGTREGMAQAQALQKIAIQAKLVAANDQFGEVSEGNIGEYLKFLPGVGIDYNSNDARGIALRGLKTNFTIVAVDGTPMASGASGGDSRRFELEQVAMNNVETTEVYKTVTPDISADATGGFINMVTKSAFDRENESLFTYNVSFNVPHSAAHLDRQKGTWGKGSHLNIRPSLEANYARRFSDKLGFNINYRLSEIYHDSPRSTLSWLYTGPGVSLQDPTLLSFIQNNEQKLTHRQSLASKVDYKITENTKLTFSGQWNWYDLLFTQRALAFTFLSANNVPAVNAPGANTANSGTGRSIQNQFLQRSKYGTTLHFNTTLTHDFANDSKAWLVGYWSKANSKYRDTNHGFVANTNAVYTGTIPEFSATRIVDSPKRPDFIFPSSGPGANSVRLLSNYTLSPNGTDNFRSRPDTAYDTKTGVNGHYAKPVDIFVVPVTLQVGAAFDKAERDIRRVNIRAAGLPTLSGSALQAYREDHLFDYGYGFGYGETMDIYRLYQDYKAGFTVVNNDFVRKFDEDNLAAYFRADIKLLPDLLLIGGVRWENRDIYANGRNQAVVRNLPATADLSYDNYYPSLTLKYTPKFNKSLVLRGGVSRTVGHPDYSELLPDFTGPTIAGANDGSITVPDKGLKPYFVNNYDVVAEYYPNRSGVASLSLFRKDVKGFIVNQALAANSAEADAVIKDYNLDPGDYAGATKRVNGKNSTLTGLEFLYNQSLTFLPKPFDALTLQFNYTKIDIDADDLDTKYAQEFAAVTEAMNIVVGYRIGKFNVTVTNNWTGDVLINIPAAQTTTVGGVGYTNRVLQYKTPEQKTSIKVEYALHRNARLYAEVRNLFYERHEYVRGYYDSDRSVKLPGQYYIYGDPFFVVGVKGSF